MQGSVDKYVLAVLLSAMALSIVRADGGFVSARPGEMAAPDQRVAIAWDGRTQTMILATKAKTDHAKQIGWIIPIKSVQKPAVELANIQIFYELDEYFGPLKSETKNQRAAGSVGGYDQIHVLEQKHLGIYEISILQATDGTQLYAWLKTNNFRLTANAPDILASYATSDFFLVAVRIDPTNDPEALKKMRSGLYHPLKISFPTNRAYFPLRVSRINPGKVTIVAYVLAKSPKQDEHNVLKLSQWQPLADGFKPRIAHCLPVDKLGYVTRLDFDGQASQFQHDVTFTDIDIRQRVAKYGKHYKTLDLSPEGWLDSAIRKGDPVSVRNAIAAGANVNRPVRYALPLHHALTSRSTYDGTADVTMEIVTELIEAGANVNDKSQTGLTALHLAVSHWRAREMVPLLIDRGADVNARNENDRTPLDYAIRQGYESDKLAVIDMLLSRGAEYTGDNLHSDRRLQEQSADLLVQAAAGGNEKVVAFLLAAGADANAVRNYPQPTTALIEAVKGSHLRIAGLLLKNDADVEATTKMKYAYESEPYAQSGLSFRAIDIAAHSGNLIMVELLLKHGANPKKGAGARSPLSMAAEHANLPMVRMLIDHGANADKQDWQAVAAASRAGHTEILKLLTGDRDDASPQSGIPLRTALENGNVDTAIFLLQKGFSAAPQRSGPSLSYLDVGVIRTGWEPRHAAAVIPQGLKIEGPPPDHMIWFYWYSVKGPLKRKTNDNPEEPTRDEPTPFYLIFREGRLVRFGGQDVLIDYLQTKTR